MDQDTRQKITDQLRTLLNREPTNNEIINGQTDTYIMAKVADQKTRESIDQVSEDLSAQVDAISINKVVK